MSEVQLKLAEVKDLYSQLQFLEEDTLVSDEEKVLIFNQNQLLSEQILVAIEEVLSNDAKQLEALFWKVKIFNGPYFNDISVMLNTTEQILDSTTDREQKVEAYDWKAWIYSEKLEMKDRAIVALEDKLIEISQIQNKRSFQDTEFGDTYYRLATIYEQLDKEDSAADYYLLSHQHTPNHFYQSYHGGRLLLKLHRFDEAFLLLDAYKTYYPGEANIVFAKEIQELFDRGLLHNHWNLFRLFFNIGMEFHTEFGVATVKEWGQKFLPLILTEIDQNPSNQLAWRMYGSHYLLIEKNSKKAYEGYTQYYHMVQQISDSLASTYIILCDKLKLTLEHFDYPIELDGFNGYAVHVALLEKATDLAEHGERDKAVYFYELAEFYGRKAYAAYDDYFTHGIGTANNNSVYEFALLCNNLGVVIKTLIELREDKVLDMDQAKFAIGLHKRGYELAPFWENLASGIAISKMANDLEQLEAFSIQLLTYYEPYTDSWFNVQFNRLKAFQQIDDLERVEAFYNEVKNGFEQTNNEDEDQVNDMINFALEYITFVRYEKKDYRKSIDLINAFFQESIYIKMEEERAYLYWWYNLGWAYYKLGDLDTAQQYFGKMAEKYGDMEEFKSTLKDIPSEFDREADSLKAKKIRDFYRQRQDKVFDFSITDKSKPHELYLKQLIDLFVETGELEAESWIEDNIHIHFIGRTQREVPDEQTHDSMLDFYFLEPNVTIRFNLVEWVETSKGFFGVGAKTKQRSKMYVLFYHFKENEEQAIPIDFDLESEYYQRKAQYLWNLWVTNLVHNHKIER
ncbi:M48 family metallopeptidase [Flavobacterium sp. NKUCC04_CG]|uniref:tetratricopeptide repeat protein n=1 Tax=Flavobacterium sp. NKUCC04_CG TaxID=2842121 RepID=UPI001C5BD389|nr:tetratricopeptide repeat protein [Flavobacterium sp. NKUCC04_CG]MBW3517598.1 tetratricopeptide repeat protein [Flavobacterium sp. NKUCC04_CG]